MRSYEEKAVRLVLEGRVTVTWINDDYSAASGTVDGETDTYRVSFSPAGRVCTCQAARHHKDCSHGVALELEVGRQLEKVAV